MDGYIYTPVYFYDNIISSRLSSIHLEIYFIYVGRLIARLPTPAPSVLTLAPTVCTDLQLHPLPFVSCIHSSLLDDGWGRDINPASV